MSDHTSRQPPVPSAGRAAFMRHHFALASDAHDAIVRGDLDEAKARARALADDPVPDMPTWGDAFKESRGGLSEREVAARIDALVRYLETIQVRNAMRSTGGGGQVATARRGLAKGLRSFILQNASVWDMSYTRVATARAS